MQTPGSSSFVYHKTELVHSLGSVQTPFVGFRIGDTVRGRVRYYNAFGQAEWSSFSNTAMIASAESGANQKQSFRKRPLCGFLPFC